MEIELINKCRACLSDSEQMHPLFHDFDQGISLADIIKNTTSFEIENDDGLSQILCQNCTTIIVDFYNFKTIFKENENQIRAFIAGNIIEDPVEENADIKQEQRLEEQEEIEEKDEDNFNENNCTTIKIQIEMSSDEDDSFEATITNNSVEQIEFTKEADNFESEESITKPYQQLNTYTCPECEYSFIRKEEFHEHFAEKHVTIKISNSDTDDFFDDSQSASKCRICKKSFPTVEAYKIHFEIHKKNVCDLCGLRFVKKSDLKDHQEIHYPDRRHICPFCHKAFKRRTVLVKHRRIHTHPRECICEICGKGFNDKGTLKTHIMLLHSKERNHICVICGLRFPLKATLDKHIRRHQNKEREFFCTQCPLAYKDKSSLDRHIFVKHSGDNIKQECNECGKLYTTVSSLLKHQRVSHSRQNLEQSE